MPGDLEIRPLAECTRCGNRVAPPLGPSFVYGVGAIGFQHCPVCGARWRCRWPASPPPRRIPVRATALIAAAVLALGAGVAAYASTRSTSEPELASATRGARSPHGPALPSAPRARYLAIVRPSNAARAELRQFVDSAPPLTPRAELDRRVATYAVAARRAEVALGATAWPAAAAPAVHELIAADATLTADLVGGIGMLNQPGLGAKVAADAVALHDAAKRARAALGLPVAGPSSDPRFPPI